MAFSPMNVGGGSGYEVAIGEASWPTSSQTTIDLGFRPKYIYLYTTASNLFMLIYDEDYSTTQCRYISGTTTTAYNFGDTHNNYIYSITDTGFTFNQTTSSGRTYKYIAIG